MARTIFLLLFSIPLWSQQDFLTLLKSEFKKWKIENIDPGSLKIKDQYISEHNGVQHIYFVQTLYDYEIYGSTAAIHLDKNSNLIFSSHRLLDFPGSKIKAPSFKLDYRDAILSVGKELEIPVDKSSIRLLSEKNGVLTIEPKGMAKQPILAQKIIAPNAQGEYQYAWQISIDVEKKSDFWNLLIDAENGEIIGKNNWTVYCSPGVIHNSSHSHTSQESFLPTNTAPSSYLVFPIPLESPDHGERELVIHRGDSLASPFGWHDVDGQPGAEFTYTRGNNVQAFLDRNGDDEPDALVVDGGKELKFIFPFTKTSEHLEVQEASVTQLFYANNYVHDFAYHYGFNETSGNFQQNNYNKGGKGGDPIMANAQDGALYNNANFSSPPDGMKGRMQMFLWGNQIGDLLTIVSPIAIAGKLQSRQAGFGGELPKIPIEAQIVLAIDETSNPTLGCGTLVNPSQYEGNIVFFDRGECQFGDKALKAQVAGAKAVIISNNEEGLIAMAPGNVGAQVTIPVIMIKKEDGERIKQYLTQGVTARMNIDTSNPPFFKDSGFDNGIVVHEYAHGISIRLTGGPANSDCLTNDEQMGEGWSDFFTLVLTNTLGENGGEIDRGIGTFALGQKIDEKGLRRKKYSLDFSSNGHSYYDVLGTTAPHPLGEVWSALLWDLYWEMAKKHGWDDDLIKGKGGNNLAIQLVMDGMKLQNCHPGFIDGRDAILAADILNNNGENECLIWDVFARRGFGWSADQGSSFNRNDGKIAFDSKPECVQTLKIEKLAPASVVIGETANISLLISNHKKDQVKNIIIEDFLAPGMEFVEGSERGTNRFSKSGNRLIFEIDQIRSGSSITLNYEVKAIPEQTSTILFEEKISPETSKMNSNSLTGGAKWKTVADTWQIENSANINDQTLETVESILVDGLRPILRFQHRYNTEPYYDGGRIEISLDRTNWIPLNQEIFKNEYNGPMNPNLFSDNSTVGFYGKTQEFREVRADLSAYKGKNIYLRFRFGSDQGNATARESVEGWKIKKIQVIDAEYFQSEACVIFSDEKECSEIPHRGIIIEPQMLTSNKAITSQLPWLVFPNPSQGNIQIQLNLDLNEYWKIDLISPQGSIIEEFRGKGPDNWVENLPKGLFFVRLETEKGFDVKKLLIH